MGIFIDQCKKRKKNKCFVCGKPGTYKTKDRNPTYACEKHSDDLVNKAKGDLPDVDDGHRSEGEMQAMRGAGIRW